MSTLEDTRRATEAAAQRRAELAMHTLALATRRLFAGVAALAAVRRMPERAPTP